MAAPQDPLPTCCRMVCVLGTCLLPDGSLELCSSGGARWEVAEGGVLMWDAHEEPLPEGGSRTSGLVMGSISGGGAAAASRSASWILQGRC